MALKVIPASTSKLKLKLTSWSKVSRLIQRSELLSLKAFRNNLRVLPRFQPSWQHSWAVQDHQRLSNAPGSLPEPPHRPSAGPCPRCQITHILYVLEAL